MAAPIFIELDGATLLAENIASYEAITGRVLQPAQTERLLINAFTEAQLRTHQQIQNACLQMLVSFADAPALDELAKLVGVTRLPASSAATTLRFTLIAGHGGVVIPAGTRAGTTDGKYVFSVVSNTTVAIGTNQVDIEAFAETPGTEANGYTAGTITEQLDPLAFVTGISNTTTSSGGADAETDDELRNRIALAPAQFSVAGPRDAYKFFAKSASSAIIDVAVELISPGTVGVYPLVAGGTTPPEILSLVEAALDPDTVVPLTDTVVVESPTVVDYDIEVDVVIYEGEDSAEIQELIEAALAEYAAEKAAAMGQDIVISQIVSRANVAGVYSVSVTSPASSEVVEVNEVAIVGTITVNVTGENEG